MSVRIHQLSKDIGMENKELIALLKSRGFEVKSASSTIDNISADAIREAPEPETPLWEEFIVRSGDNLSLLFSRAGFSDRDVYEIVHTAPQGRGLERIYPGQSLAFQRDESGDPSKGICHEECDAANNDVWWLGFDCAHLGDLSPAYKTEIWFGDEVYRDFCYVEREVQWLAGQLSSRLSDERGS